MIEKIVIDHLSDILPAYGEMPESYEPPFAVVEKLGGGETNHIPRAMLAIQSYGATLLEAAETNEQVKARMNTLIELAEVSKVSLNSDYNFTDPQTKRYRYQAVYDITYY